MTLNEIVSTTLATLSEIEESGGEISPTLESKLDFTQGELAEKVDGYVLLTRHLESQAEVYKVMAAEFTAKAKASLSNVDRLKERLRFAAGVLNVDSFEGERFIVKIGKGRPRVVANEELCPPQFKRITQTITIDKDRISKELTEGAIIQGCSLEETRVIRIFPFTKTKKLEGF